MTTPTLAIGRPTIVDRLVTRRLATDVALVLGGVLLTGLLAQVSIPLWPVPVTGQTLGVLLTAVGLGATRGGISMVLYALIGALGVPLFSEQSGGWTVISGATGGYIVGFIPSAILAGWLAQRQWDRKILRGFLAFVAGSVVTFAFGLPWLAAWLGINGYPNDLTSVLDGGLYPFILGGVIKAVLGAGIIWCGWRLIDRRTESRNIPG